MRYKNKRILIVSSTGFSSAYSGTLHLINALIEFGLILELIVFCERGEASFYKKRFKKVKAFEKYRSTFGLHKIVSLYRTLYIVFKLLNFDNVIITEGYFLVISKFIKKLKPSSTIIQFCQELWYSRDHPWSKQAVLFDKYSHIPDIVIDVETNRARIRKEIFKLKRLPYVLLNTLPHNGMPTRKKSGELSSLVGFKFPENTPIIIYTGGSGTEKPFYRLIDIIKHVQGNCFFLSIINTDDNEIRKFEQYAEGNLNKNSYKFCSSIQRIKILETIWEADCGLIDYSYTVQPTFNQKYCAPTKLFEYMASGLAIAGSNNESLRSIIEDNCIGLCADDDSVENFAKKIDLIISDLNSLRIRKERSFDLFTTRYCYEKINYPVINEIVEHLT